AMYSDVVKQSWVSMPSRAQQSAMPARRYASVIARRVCGRTYGWSLLSATLASNVSGAVAWPQPWRRAMESSARPWRFAYASANLADASTTATAPSVTCEQSLTLMRPPITALYDDVEHACSSFMYQVRVCALGFRLALP